MNGDLIVKLLKAFPGSFINNNFELIAHSQSNTYLILASIKTEEQLKCRMLEWFSRPAYKTCPYSYEANNKKFHKFMLDGINKFLGTSFTEDDMVKIYTKLGNGCNLEKTKEFVRTGYDFKVLE